MDRTQIGLYFAKDPVDQPWQTIVIQGLKGIQKIPAGSADFVTAGHVFLQTDTVIHSVIPHMHLLGKSVTVTMTPPGGKPVVLVDIPAWDYRWQETYWFKEPIHAKVGTKLEIKAHFDNSEGNPNNPSKPPKLVKYGEQTTDEMLFAFFGATSEAKPSQRIVFNAFPPEGSGEPPIKGKLTPQLEGLLGTWDTSTELKMLGRNLNFKGKEVSSKVFGGNFVRSQASTDGNRDTFLFVYSFDEAIGQYHMWMYDPMGMESEWTGSFDEKTRTIEWTAHLEDGVKGTMHWRFAEGGGYKWDLVILSDGKPFVEVSGDRTKKKVEQK